jgi:ankyrin repeat protein
LLKDKRVDPSDDSNLAIQWASGKGHMDLVKMLLKYPRVDPSDENNEAVREAMTNGHIEVMKILLEDQRVYPPGENDDAIVIELILIVDVSNSSSKIDALFAPAHSAFGRRFIIGNNVNLACLHKRSHLHRKLASLQLI